MKLHSGKFKRHKYYIQYGRVEGGQYVDIFKCVNPSTPDNTIMDVVIYGAYTLGEVIRSNKDYTILKPMEYYITKQYDKSRSFINSTEPNQTFYELTQDEFLMQVLSETI